MKRVLVELLVVFVLSCGFVGRADAALQTIGTATLAGESFGRNLIYDNDSSLIWLDHSPNGTTGYNGFTQSEALDWASNLTITSYNLNDGLSINWSGDWRIPTVAEFDHLAYDEFQATYGPPQSLYRSFGFNSMNRYLYWTSATNKMYSIGYGRIINPIPGEDRTRVIAARSGTVVPLPGAVWLLGSGLLGLGITRKQRGGEEIPESGA